jgi:pimeloyl-ACP methyl ester carboxylesterase
MMHCTKNIIVPGANGKEMAVDIFHGGNEGPRPVIIYAHGFNGFKDWGNFDLVAKRFVAEDYTFVKFNFSHNGTTPGNPEEFVDLEAFGNNNYSKELEDVSKIIDWTCAPDNPYRGYINADSISLIGHSMGGGIVILQAAADKRVRKLVTWASVSECKTPWGAWPAKKLADWKKDGVQYYTNSRTNQQMPLYYQLYEDFQHNTEKLDIKKAIEGLRIPVLVCHGQSDISVPVEKAYELISWQPAAKLFTLDTDHVFDRHHPWTSKQLPRAMEAVVNETIGFLKTN